MISTRNFQDLVAQNRNKVIVGQCTDGQAVNDCDLRDFILDEDDYVIVFDTAEHAMKHIERKRMSADSLALVKSIGTCFHCGSPLFPSFIQGYTSQCFNCDEDFFSFEQETEQEGSV